jgi:hypothetical protein
MKVRELVSQLQLGYLPDDEVIVAYWDKETIERYGSGWGGKTDLKLTDDQWGEVVNSYENGEWHWQGSAAEDFVEIASRVAEK